ncbi:MAG: hypothetical protein IT557_17485 [Alphaproteobacteria bacterium]|nr:hypothetical protein [Alphaproteobacteria bacterium]
MGVDFIRKAAKSFHKGLDRSRIDLGTPDLFTRLPDCEPRTYAATIRSNQKLNRGEDLCVRLDGAAVVAQRGMEIVAQFESPPAELIDALKDSHGEACGTVREIHEIADTAEITVC